MAGWEEFTELEPMELLAAKQGMAVGVEDVGEAIEVEGGERLWEQSYFATTIGS